MTSAAITITYTLPGQTTPVSTAPSATTTTLPGTEITIVGGPNATSNIPGDKTDPADFYGIILVAAGIAVAIILTRLLFRRRGPDEEQPR